MTFGKLVGATGAYGNVTGSWSGIGEVHNTVATYGLWGLCFELKLEPCIWLASDQEQVQNHLLGEWKLCE